MPLKRCFRRPPALLTRKLLVLLTLITCLQATARGFSQSISLSLREAKFETVLREIQRQSGYSFVYTRAQLQTAYTVDIHVNKMPLRETLDQCFRNQPLRFVIEGRYIILQTKNPEPQPVNSTPPYLDLSGKVINENGESIAGVTITSALTGRIVMTSEKGEFIIKGISKGDRLIMTCIGYNKAEVEVTGPGELIITLKVAIGNLDETIVMAYGRTAKRISTGNISKVSAVDISKQPVSNPLAALHGRVPGLIVSQTNGLAGSAVQVQLRGQNSLTQGSAPLFVIDGIPFAPGNDKVSELGSILTAQNGQGLGPFSSINPADIESIEVLKDGDATAIYGSRGANGVILITTKKGRPGRTKVMADINIGFSKATRTLKMLNTRQYLQVRREAFANDGITPNGIPGTPGYAPDLFLWDTNRYTDWQKIFWGSTAHSQNVNLSISGGSQQTQFLLGGSYLRESSILPGDLLYQRGALNVSIDHSSLDKRFTIAFRNNLSRERNELIHVSGPQFLNPPPNAPPLFDSLGNLVWSENGVQVDNPYAALLKKYNAETENALHNLSIRYRIMPGLLLYANLGYNTYQLREKTTQPISSKDPDLNPTGSLGMNTSRFYSWIVEPHIEYSIQPNQSRLTFLLGGSWQEQTRSNEQVQAEGYTTDDLLESLGAGTITYKGNTFGRYRYNGFFARINYNRSDRYIVNLSGRRDGSSRFGPGRRFANFGAIGAAWIFSKEKFIDQALPFLSFGKLRASYGLTGNDQIGDYQYLDSWSPTYGTNPSYQGIPGLSPRRLFNEVYGWEVNRKLEAGIDLGFFRERILLSLAWFRNRSDNQLVDFRLPSQTGFSNILLNFPALIENSGLEIETSTRNIENKLFSWRTQFNITLTRNRLLSYPGIESSSYASSYVVGEPLSVIYKFRSLGVDPATGVFSIEDINGDSLIKSGYGQDYTVSGHTSPKFYGGLTNIFTYKGFELFVFLEYRKQTGRSYLASLYSQEAFMPGMMYNQPTFVLDRWQKPGDNSAVQRFTASTGSDAYKAASQLANSNGIFDDASYIRFKTLSLAYSLPDRWIKQFSMQSCQFSLRAQNLFTITNYKGIDPESQNLFAVPLLKTWMVSARLTF